MASDAVALLGALGIGSAIVIGHSMGGHVAGWMAARHPGRVMALAILDKSANGPAGAAPVEAIEPVDPVTKDWPLPFASLKEASDYIGRAMDSELSRQYFLNSLFEGPDGYSMRFSSQAIAANIAHYRGWFDLLPEIRCPTMLVRASGDGGVPGDDYAKMRTLLPDCMAFEMSSPDHNVHLSDTKEFYSYFDEFIARNGL